MKWKRFRESTDQQASEDSRGRRIGKEKGETSTAFCNPQIHGTEGNDGMRMVFCGLPQDMPNGRTRHFDWGQTLTGRMCNHRR